MPTTPLPVDEVRFARLWAAAEPALRGYLHGLVGDLERVEDLLQEVALASLRGFAGYDPQRPFTAWTLGIAHHLAVDRLQRRERLVSTDPAVLADLAAVSGEVAEELAAEREALRACLAQLPGRAWEILRLHYDQGLAADDVGGALGLARGHVRVLLHRARQALRTCVERRLRPGGSHV